MEKKKERTHRNTHKLREKQVLNKEMKTCALYITNGPWSQRLSLVSVDVVCNQVDEPNL